MSGTRQQYFDAPRRDPTRPELCIGDIVRTVQVAHRDDRDTEPVVVDQSFENVVQVWVLENAEATVSNVLGDRAMDHSTRRESLTHEKELQQILDKHSDPETPGEQATLTEVTGGA